MKKADMDYIKKEEKFFLDAEKKYRRINKKTEFFTDMSVEWLYPKKDTYLDWINASAHAGLVTWEEHPYEMIKKYSIKEKERKVLKLLKERPISVILEMPKFAFKINNLSRAMTHQIVRHRKMAFGQQSIRVVDAGTAPTRIPLSLKKNKKLTEEYNSVVYQTKKMYKNLIENGVPREQARNILPIGTTTSIVVTTDLRALIEYFKSRTLNITQGEHHYLTYLIAKEMSKKQKKFFEFTCTRVKNLKNLIRKDWRRLL